MTTDTRPCLADWVVENYGGGIREALSLTDEYSSEHGFVAHGDVDNHEQGPMVKGDSSSINVATSISSAGRAVQVNVHTHPHGSVIPSDADWRGFINRLALYGTYSGFEEGWRRGMVIAADAINKPGQFAVRSMELTDVALGRTPEEQMEWANHALGVLNDPSSRGIGSDKDVAELMGDEVRVCTRFFNY